MSGAGEGRGRPTFVAPAIAKLCTEAALQGRVGKLAALETMPREYLAST
jgi:hypothetical protein